MTTSEAKIIAWAKSVGGYFTAAQAKAEKISAADIKALIQSGHLKNDGGKFRVVTPKKAAQVETNQPELF